MQKPKPARQRVRAALPIVSFLLFPIIMNYLSPYLIIAGAAEGIINGSFIIFGSMFISSLFAGRLWCGWLCPAGGLGEISLAINNKPVSGKKIDWIKWLIWIIWLGVIAWMAIRAGGYRAADFFYGTENGISVAGSPDRPILFAYLIYYIVIGIFFFWSIFAGRRAGCHAICWMAPFMILGRKLRNLAAWPSLRLAAEPALCSDCMTCSTNCPMSLDVNAMVQVGKMENSECILCGNCVDHCPKNAIRYSFSAGK